MLVDIGHKQLFPVPLAEQQHESQRLREGWACISHHRGVSGTEAMEALVQRTECPKTAQGWTSRLRGTSSGTGPRRTWPRRQRSGHARHHRVQANTDFARVELRIYVGLCSVTQMLKRKSVRVDVRTRHASTRVTCAAARRRPAARAPTPGPHAAVSAERPRARREGGGSTEHRPAIETRRGRREEGAPGGTCVRRHQTDCMCVRC